MVFEIRRGTNVSHWLSQSKQRGEARRAYLGRDDVFRPAEGGLEHNGITWANWEYKGGFGLFDKDGQPTALAGVC